MTTTSATITGPHFRITVLTSALLRFEYSATDSFEDRRTQLVVSREFEVPEFTVVEHDDYVDILTSDLHVRYDRQPFSASGLIVTMRKRFQEAHFTMWRYGDNPWGTGSIPSNLGGTARTLDDIDGPTPIETGILSRAGFAVVDDSTTLALDEDGTPVPRVGVEEDLYFFGYGHRYGDALRDWFTLTGPSPLLPRWTLGNWWSRYHRYDDAEYLALMDRFRERQVPFSVAVIDMDWHLVDIDPDLGSGWTGYSWNRELFADPEEFLSELHGRHLKVGLNVHPADGIRRHEDAYPLVAKALGIEPDSGAPVAFDIASPEFVDAYLQYAHHPHEEMGVDFWWLDWQSGDASRMPGLDPLWMLNDVHYKDSARRGDRAVTFSRYAGLGSHRYPIGFSGDSVASWDSLAFQPYFTATAANVGYFWWSHDIGGHFHGTKSNEMAARWTQFGVFSPIYRLHSSKSPFNGKEPWRFDMATQETLERFMALRHALVPYLYSAMWTSHTEGVGPVRPMYHDYPSCEGAYGVQNQYMFGPDLLVAPITAPGDRATHLGQARGWLPDGEWYDFFTGRRYVGGRELLFHRTAAEMPVLARAGALVPMAADVMADVDCAPESLVLKVFPVGGVGDGGVGCGGVGAGDGLAERGRVAGVGDLTGEAFLREDSGLGDVTSSDQAVTRVWQQWTAGGVGGAGEGAGGERSDSSERSDSADGRAEFVVEIGIDPVVGAADVVPELREFTLELIGVESAEGAATEQIREGDHVLGLRIVLGAVAASSGTVVKLTGVRLLPNRWRTEVFELLDEAEIEFDLKSAIMSATDHLEGASLVATLTTMELPGNLGSAITELIP